MAHILLRLRTELGYPFLKLGLWAKVAAKITFLCNKEPEFCCVVKDSMFGKFVSTRRWCVPVFWSVLRIQLTIEM